METAVATWRTARSRDAYWSPMTSLHASIVAGDMAAFRAQLVAGADPAQTVDHGWEGWGDALWLACRLEHLEMVEVLLADGRADMYSPRLLHSLKPSVLRVLLREEGAPWRWDPSAMNSFALWGAAHDAGEPDAWGDSALELLVMLLADGRADPEVGIMAVAHQSLQRRGWPCCTVPRRTPASRAAPLLNAEVRWRRRRLWIRTRVSL
jgi:hypothetical protein